MYTLVRQEDNSRPLWVCWHEFARLTIWRQALSVKLSDSWLVVEFADGEFEVIPDHIVRGRVFIKRSDTQPD